MTNHSSEFPLRQSFSERLQRVLSAMSLRRGAGRDPHACQQACTPEEWARHALDVDTTARAHDLILGYHPAALMRWSN